VALNIAAMSEALVLAAKAGVEPETRLSGHTRRSCGQYGSRCKGAIGHGPQVQSRIRINLHIKDLNNVLETSHELNVPLPLMASVMEMMQALKVDGMGELDHGSLVRFYEKMATVEVKR